MQKPNIHETAHRKNNRFIERKNKQIETQRDRKQRIFITSLAHHAASLQLVLGIGELGPMHARSALGGVRSGNKNQVRCSIT